MDNKENTATVAAAAAAVVAGAGEGTGTEEQVKANADQATAAIKEESGKSVEDSLQEWVNSGTAWGSSWLKSAKEKTYTTFELVKKDLTEFGDVMANEASALASTTVESVKQQAQNLQQIMNFEEEEEEEKQQQQQQQQQQKEEEKKVESSTDEAEGSSSTYTLGWAPKLPSVPTTITNNPWLKTIVDTVKNIAQENTAEGEDEFTERIYPETKLTRRSDLPHHVLYGIQTNPNTYTKTPDGDEELFKMWCDDFKLTEYNGEINALLSNCPPMRALYQELVPSGVENAMFWQRYFYKVHQAELLARCKIDTEKQLAEAKQSVENEVVKDQKETADSEEKRSSGTESCLTIDTESTQGQNSPGMRSTTDESWSLCSSTNVDIQELHDELKDGPQTPKADSTNLSDKSDGWVNWDE